MYNQVSEYGCWQYTTRVNTFECIGNVSGITDQQVPVIKPKEDLYDYSCEKAKLKCLAKNARIRYVRVSDTTGKYDTSLPLTNLTQNLLNPIFFVGLKSSNLTQNVDGTLEYQHVCNTENTMSDKLGGFYPKPRAKCSKNDQKKGKKNRRVDKKAPKISCDTNTTTITAYKDQYVFWFTQLSFGIYILWFQVWYLSS